jgi:hypothetical protein
VSYSALTIVRQIITAKKKEQSLPQAWILRIFICKNHSTSWRCNEANFSKIALVKLSKRHNLDYLEPVHYPSNNTERSLFKDCMKMIFSGFT